MTKYRIISLGDTPMVREVKVHYAINGEWGSERVNCHRYFTTDVRHTGNQSEVTCKWCLKNFKTE